MESRTFAYHLDYKGEGAEAFIKCLFEQGVASRIYAQFNTKKSYDEFIKYAKSDYYRLVSNYIDANDEIVKVYQNNRYIFKINISVESTASGVRTIYWVFVLMADDYRENFATKSEIIDEPKIPTSADTLLDTKIGKPENEQWKIVERCIQLYPTCSRAYHERAIMKFLDNKDVAGALADSDKAVALDSTDSDTYHFRAEMREKVGDKTGMCEDFKKASELISREPDYLMTSKEIQARLRKKMSVASAFMCTFKFTGIRSRGFAIRGYFFPPSLP